MSPELLNGSAQEWLARLGAACWQGALVAAGVWLLCRTVRLSARTRCWLWWAVGARLLVGLLPLGAVPLAVLPPEKPIGPISRIGPIRPIRPITTTAPPNNQQELYLREEPAAPLPEPVHPAVWWVAAWLLGVAVRLGIAGRQSLVMRRLVREAAPVEDPGVLALLRRLLAEAGVHKEIPLREHTAVRGPLVAGLWRPVILLPASEPNAAMDLTTDELRMALAHEVIHLRRRDLLFSLLPCFAQALFFFHPFAWLAAREHRLALEAACDLEALRLAGAPVSDYGRLLLRFAAGAERRTAAGFGVALGAASGFRTLERRLKMLQSAPLTAGHAGRRTRVTACLALVAVAGLAIPWRLEAQKAKAAPKPSKAVTKPVQKLRRSAQSPKIYGHARSLTINLPASQNGPNISLKAHNATVQRGAATITADTLTVRQGAGAPAVALAPPAGTTTALTSRSLSAQAVVQSGSTTVAATPGAVSLPTQVTTSGTAALAAPVVSQNTTEAITTVDEGLTTTVLAGQARKGKTLSRLSGSLSTHGLAGKSVTGTLTTSVAQNRGLTASTSVLSGRTAPLTAKGLAGTALTAKSAPLSTRLNRSSSLSVGGTAVLARPGISDSFGPARHTQFSFKETPLVSVLRTLYSQSHADFVVALGEFDQTRISGDYKNVRLDAILTDLLNRAPVNGRLVALDERGVGVVTSADDTPSNRVTLRFHDCPATEALEALFTATHVGCAISSDLKRSTVTASLTNTDFKTALETILKSLSQPATYRVEGGVYHIIPR